MIGDRNGDRNGVESLVVQYDTTLHWGWLCDKPVGENCADVNQVAPPRLRRGIGGLRRLYARATLPAGATGAQDERRVTGWSPPRTDGLFTVMLAIMTVTGYAEFTGTKQSVPKIVAEQGSPAAASQGIAIYGCRFRWKARALARKTRQTAKWRCPHHQEDHNANLVRTGLTAKGCEHAKAQKQSILDQLSMFRRKNSRYEQRNATREHSLRMRRDSERDNPSCSKQRRRESETKPRQPTSTAKMKQRQPLPSHVTARSE